MINFSKILGRTFCLFLMIHLLAISVREDYVSKLFNKSCFEQILEIEEDNDTKNKSTELDNFDDEFVVSAFNQSIHFSPVTPQQNCLATSFQYLQITLPQCNSEILIPPPRA